VPKDRDARRDAAPGKAAQGTDGTKGGKLAKAGKASKGLRTTKAKKKCCKDKPRCAECPVVLMRLERMGYATQDPEKKRRYTVSRDVPKKAMLVARQR
jgi:hypothetical protein